MTLQTRFTSLPPMETPDDDFRQFDLYRRKWRITIFPRNKFGGYDEGDKIIISDSEYKDRALRVVFNVESSVSTPLYGDVIIYNLSQDMSDVLREEGAKVQIEAGYQSKQRYGIIWKGFIYYFLDYRENVVDRITHLHCIWGQDVIMPSFVVASVSGRQTLKDRIEYYARQADIQVKPSDAVEADKKETVRRMIVFGSPIGAIRRDIELLGRQVTADEESTLTDTNIVSEIGPDDAIVVSPQTGLIGIPTQIPKGISLTTLLDSRIAYRPQFMQIKLEDSGIRFTPMMFNQQLPLWSLNGVYKVARVVHRGDTRGNDWHTTVDALVSADVILNAAVPKQSTKNQTANGPY